MDHRYFLQNEVQLQTKVKDITSLNLFDGKESLTCSSYYHSKQQCPKQMHKLCHFNKHEL